MSFRCEEKMRLSSSKIFEFMKWIQDNNGSQLYPSRIVNSLYLDNKDLSMFENSVEGITPRKKLRIRTYGNNFLLNKNSTFKKELKITSVEGRFKTSESYEDSIMNVFNGIYDIDYGLCFPVLNVLYQRDYFMVNNIRITIDKNILYKKVSNKDISSTSVSDKFNVVEIKYNQNIKDNLFHNSFPFERFRFSKYCRGIEFTKLNNCLDI